jgi:hypothetical protein
LRGSVHIPIERFLCFVMGWLNLTELEQAHLIRCAYCVEWLDSCVTEKVTILTKS